MTDAATRLRATRQVVHEVGIGVVALAAGLSVVAVVVTTTQPRGTLLAGLGVLTMIAPVLVARRAPLAAAGAQAVATVVNVIIFGRLIRCGSCLPAAFYVAYEQGVRARGVARVVGLALELAGVAAQCWFDPQLQPATFILMGPVSLLFFGSGLVARSRNQLLDRLRDRNTELRLQREQTARLAVENDRERVRADLNDGLRARIVRISQLVSSARSGDTGIAESRGSLVEIERAGRQALERMREVVGTMRSAPTWPEPGLASLVDLVRTATTADVRLSVTGGVRTLPASVELSGYRIVEHLLSVLEDAPAAKVQVSVIFGAEFLELVVTGPDTTIGSASTALAAVRRRAAVHGGTVQIARPADQWEARVLLPLIFGHA